MDYLQSKILEDYTDQIRQVEAELCDVQSRISILSSHALFSRSALQALNRYSELKERFQNELMELQAVVDQLRTLKYYRMFSLGSSRKDLNILLKKIMSDYI
ncbi:hypothetical protein [Persicobacter diffluens]|uniref:Uncharacterized protein n=1 Tax=Persicobacter diffluens TaxID=981 RepID=A0AAN5ANS7_9BACT|nr:hypothetical protein PEDI_37000 [Persicobacter diffluens]